MSGVQKHDAPKRVIRRSDGFRYLTNHVIRRRGTFPAVTLCPHPESPPTQVQGHSNLDNLELIAPALARLTSCGADAPTGPSASASRPLRRLRRLARARRRKRASANSSGQKSECKDCGGADLCEHQRIRRQWKDCGGGTIGGRHVFGCVWCTVKSLCGQYPHNVRTCQHTEATERGR